LASPSPTRTTLIDRKRAALDSLTLCGRSD
jgi:hypothetical protein